MAGQLGKARKAIERSVLRWKRLSAVGFGSVQGAGRAAVLSPQPGCNAAPGQKTKLKRLRPAQRLVWFSNVGLAIFSAPAASKSSRDARASRCGLLLSGDEKSPPSNRSHLRTERSRAGYTSQQKRARLAPDPSLFVLRMLEPSGSQHRQHRAGYAPIPPVPGYAPAEQPLHAIRSRRQRS